MPPYKTVGSGFIPDRVLRLKAMFFSHFLNGSFKKEYRLCLIQKMPS